MRLPCPAWLLLATLACAHRPPPQQGKASWYGPGFAGKPTASGVPFRPSRRTAAHRTLPFGTVVRVTRTDTGEHVRVVINDRGPYAKGRVIDLSKKAAKKLDMLDAGVAPVKIEVVGCRRRYEACKKGS